MPLLAWFLDVAVASMPLGCGAPGLLPAVDAYCRERADPSERLGCSVARYAFSHCDATPELRTGDGGELYGAIPDPRGSWYAWMLTFERSRRGWRLAEFKYAYDDCDAGGIPAPPRGPLRLSKLIRR